MTNHIEQTLVLLKPDAVERALVGKVISRFEDAGFKIVAMKLTKTDKETALKHYTEDIAIRRGQKVRDIAVDYICSGPVVAMVIEGVNAVENVRKFAGTTEPSSAPPGTIRGDYSHTTMEYSNAKDMPAKNIIHASGNKEEAAQEINIWFTPQEIVEYTAVHEIHTR
jgi:nucleoside-diphosphate kinase